jgi:hypothetical protein
MREIFPVLKPLLHHLRTPITHNKFRINIRSYSSDLQPANVDNHRQIFETILADWKTSQKEDFYDVVSSKVHLSLTYNLT